MLVKNLVIIPTYNEVGNVGLMIDKVFSLYPEYGLLIVDDDSKDGTIDVVMERQQKHQKLWLIQRKGQKGLGKSYIDGMLWALDKGVEKIVQMDCDFSHDPKDIALLLKESNQSDLVVGSRYINGGKIINWPFFRLVISKLANFYIRMITKMPIIDCTGGFKCWNTSLLKQINLKTISSEGYSFQMEMNYRAYKEDSFIREIPIVFEERKRGISKVSESNIYESLLTPWKLVRSRK